ncbi:uncharacterized protein LOC122939197 [Bufo gargarizans]|uniref:uncharacterized protein LOC122939197 n=1 Tax=Bufo gargarizans TaxID=30331 RepID=UPI001CF393FF|nr:uncharacterized protein LOC122939197 [Bufo gargarizans]
MPRWDVEKLITLVQERPELWDTRQNAYSDRIKKDASWEKVARSMRRSEWAKADSRGRAELVKQTKTRWASCRDQFRRELTSKGQSGEGSSTKRAYIYTAQLQFLRPVMELRPTVDSLDPSQDSDTSASEAPAGFSPQATPSPTPAEDPEDSTLAEDPLPPCSPPRIVQPQPRRRRQLPPSTSGPESREAIDARLIEFLAQRRSEGVEEKTLRGLGQLLRHVTPLEHHECLASLAVVFKMFALPNHGDILGKLNAMKVDIENAAQQQSAGPFEVAPQASQGPAYHPQPHYGLPQGPMHQVGQPLYPGSFTSGGPQQANVRPRSTFTPGSFTQDLLNL